MWEMSLDDKNMKIKASGDEISVFSIQMMTDVKD